MKKALFYRDSLFLLKQLDIGKALLEDEFMKQKNGILGKIHGVLTAVFSASLVSLKGQKSLSFSGFSGGGGGGKNPSSKNKPSEPHLSPSKTTQFSDQNRRSQNRADTKKTRRHFFKFSLNTTFLLVLSKLFYKVFKGSNHKQAKFNPNPTAPQDVFKLLKETKAHQTAPYGRPPSRACDSQGWPTLTSWPAEPVYRGSNYVNTKNCNNCPYIFSEVVKRYKIPKNALNNPCPANHYCYSNTYRTIYTSPGGGNRRTKEWKKTVCRHESFSTYQEY